MLVKNFPFLFCTLISGTQIRAKLHSFLLTSCQVLHFGIIPDPSYVHSRMNSRYTLHTHTPQTERATY